MCIQVYRRCYLRIQLKEYILKDSVSMRPRNFYSILNQDLHLIKRRCNPSLLALAPCFTKLDKLETAVSDAAIKFVNSNLPDDSTIKSVFIQRLKFSKYILKKAVNGDPIEA